MAPKIYTTRPAPSEVKTLSQMPNANDQDLLEIYSQGYDDRIHGKLERVGTAADGRSQWMASPDGPTQRELIEESMLEQFKGRMLRSDTESEYLLQTVETRLEAHPEDRDIVLRALYDNMCEPHFDDPERRWHAVLQRPDQAGHQTSMNDARRGQEEMITDVVDNARKGRPESSRGENYLVGGGMSSEDGGASAADDEIGLSQEEMEALLGKYGGKKMIVKSGRGCTRPFVGQYLAKYPEGRLLVAQALAQAHHQPNFHDALAFAHLTIVHPGRHGTAATTRDQHVDGDVEERVDDEADATDGEDEPTDDIEDFMDDEVHDGGRRQSSTANNSTILKNLQQYSCPIPNCLKPLPRLKCRRTDLVTHFKNDHALPPVHYQRGGQPLESNKKQNKVIHPWLLSQGVNPIGTIFEDLESVGIVADKENQIDDEGMRESVEREAGEEQEDLENMFEESPSSKKVKGWIWMKDAEGEDEEEQEDLEEEPAAEPPRKKVKGWAWTEDAGAKRVGEGIAKMNEGNVIEGARVRRPKKHFDDK